MRPIAEIVDAISRRTLTLDGTDHPVQIDKNDVSRAYLPLARLVRERSACVATRRYIVGISGPPGAGKSVSATILAACLEELGAGVVVIPLDGFHYPNEYLRTHRGPDHAGEERSLADLKGWYPTFNVKRALDALEAVRAGQQVRLPVYSRVLHDPVEGGLSIEPSHHVVLVEGNYLFFREGLWNRVYELLDLTVFVTAPREVLIAQLRERHMRGGRSAREAEEKIRKVDEPNMDAILGTRNRAEFVIEGVRGSLAMERKGV
ncbi:MAG TPA: nucleoside triphosphate hydrolase [Candidatus Latescibacteria bacterium]|nr:nucleoside triphosphate hydrolase [Candidatus Latescibacterota bacterium]